MIRKHLLRLRKKKLSGKTAAWLSIGVTLFIVYSFLLPDQLFHASYSTVLLDRSGNLLNASISSDGQWRFPIEAEVPEKFAKAITLFEDKRFYYHPGVDPISTARAIWQNIKAGHVVSGGSTLTMQVVRLSRHNPSRTIWEKLVEMILATRVEVSFSKKEILALYAAHAPFGGNVVGLEAACWRYFGRQPDALSWAEAALLAVLPNRPSLINLSSNRELLKGKRDRLLRRLHAHGAMDDLSLDLALAEALPLQPQPMPRLASHLLDRATQEDHRSKKLTSTLDIELQKRVNDLLHQHAHRLRGNQIFNAAALVLRNETGEALAYVGNVAAGINHEESVDIITSPRSTGSILKPFLYAAMQQEGQLLPQTLVPDIPTIMSGFSPKNFSHQYDGAVPADQALIRSLNIPAVHELIQYRYEKFYSLLKDMGISTLHQPADHYGLALILGGAEGTLWDVTGAYASMARTLNHYFLTAGQERYFASDFHPPHYVPRAFPADTTAVSSNGVLDAASIWLTFEAMKELYRPGEETGWRNFQSSKKIAWKTGTSFGFRDAWAVGVNADFAVGVWVGNADGEGRPGLTGTETAAPILFDIFSQLPGNSWFDMPRSEMMEMAVCATSGQRATDLCGEKKVTWVNKAGASGTSCGYHKRIHLSADGKYRVHSACESLEKMQVVSRFVLPPVQEYYYRPHHALYKTLPPYRVDCANPSSTLSMDLVYPRWDSKIFVPRQLDGSLGSTIFQIVHRDPAATVYWHLDGTFVGTTTNPHKLPFAPSEGKHLLTLMDTHGETLERPFQVISTR